MNFHHHSALLYHNHSLVSNEDWFTDISCLIERKFCFLPKHCHLTNKILWLEYAIKSDLVGSIRWYTDNETVKFYTDLHEKQIILYKLLNF